MIDRNDLCFCGSGKKWKKCHYPTLPLEKEYLKKYGIVLKTPAQIEGIKKACQLTAFILDELCKKAQEGVTTLELDLLSRELHSKYGATPAPLNYGTPPYPKSICTSLNDVVCHGIPDETKLKEGDILNIDVSACLGGYYGDTSRMVVIGETSNEKKHVVAVAHECLERGMQILKPGILLNQIGEAIESYAHQQGCSVVHQFVGHGVGLSFHEPPQISHCRNALAIPLAAGMTFTVEPMINGGVSECTIDRDGWTARTKDGKPSAQWEHTVLITEQGFEILTLLAP